MKSPDAIICGDIHLRDDTPQCRTDDFQAAQWRKIDWLAGLQQEHGCPVLDAGDLFHRWKVSSELVVKAFHHLPVEMYTVPGNHELPNHNLSLIEKSGLGVLKVSERIRVLDAGVMARPFPCTAHVHPFPWGFKTEPLLGRKNEAAVDRNIALCHVMTYTGRNPWPGCTDEEAGAMLKRLKGFDLVITGHNHKPFVIEHEGRLLVNPGSLMRQAGDQADHRPRVYFWYSETNSVEEVFVPIDEGVVSRVHLAVVEDKEERLEAFVSRLKGDWEIGLSFERNLEEFFNQNRVRTPVKNLVWRAVRSF